MDQVVTYVMFDTLTTESIVIIEYPSRSDSLVNKQRMDYRRDTNVMVRN